MTADILRECVPLWDQFEAQLKLRYIDLIQSGSLDMTNPIHDEASKIYRELGWKYWGLVSGANGRWIARFEEFFFEPRYLSFEGLLFWFEEMDACAEEKRKNLPRPIREDLTSPLDAVRKKAAEECFNLTLAPLLAERKQKILEQLRELEGELSRPVPYELSLGLKDCTLKIVLEFQSKVKQNRAGLESLDGFTYSFHGREYTDIQSLWVTDGEKLSDNVALGQDAYGEGVLRTYVEIPTFDLGDREWDSQEMSFLFFDGRDIHLVVMHGGYYIASLKFYEHLISADERLKPYFERLGWPTEGVHWKGSCV